MRFFLSADSQPRSSVVLSIQLGRPWTNIAGVIDTLGIHDVWEDAGPAVEIRRWLQTHQLHPIGSANTPNR